MDGKVDFLFCVTLWWCVSVVCLCLRVTARYVCGMVLQFFACLTRCGGPSIRLRDGIYYVVCMYRISFWHVVCIVIVCVHVSIVVACDIVRGVCRC